MSLVVSRTPFRISFFGGGTDYPDWYLKEGGAVLSTTIDKYCYLICRHLPPYFPNTYRVVWTHIETVSSISEILHPAVREGLRMMGVTDEEGLEIIYQGDIPARTGMATSSAFAVGFLHALSVLRKQYMTKEELYHKAIDLEQNWLKDSVGSQDQVAVAVGGLNAIRFRQDGSIHVEPVEISAQRRDALNQNLMMFYTGGSRMGSGMAAKIIQNLDQKARHLRRMHQMVDEAVSILTSDRGLDDFGLMLDETWHLKRDLSEGVSNPTIDDIYGRAMAAGALGGKLLGAGASGFMLFYVPQEQQPAVKAALADILHVPFKFDTHGSVLMNSVSDSDVANEAMHFA